MENLAPNSFKHCVELFVSLWHPWIIKHRRSVYSFVWQFLWPQAAGTDKLIKAQIKLKLEHYQQLHPNTATDTYCLTGRARPAENCEREITTSTVRLKKVKCNLLSLLLPAMSGHVNSFMCRYFEISASTTNTVSLCWCSQHLKTAVKLRTNPQISLWTVSTANCFLLHIKHTENRRGHLFNSSAQHVKCAWKQ